MQNCDYKSVFDMDSFVNTFDYEYEDSGDVARSCKLITGYTSLDNSRLVFTAIDNTEEGLGLAGRVYAEKIAKTVLAAIHHGAPFVLFLGSSNVDASQGVNILIGYGMLFKALREAQGKIPRICVISGQCIGINATIASMFDFTIALGDDTGLETAEIYCSNETEVKNAITELIGYLPENSDAVMPVSIVPVLPKSFSSGDITKLKGEALLRELSDAGNTLVMKKNVGSDVIAAFAAFGGINAAVIVTDCGINGGMLSSMGLYKLASFRKLCNQFRIPVIQLLDFDGVDATPSAVARIAQIVFSEDVSDTFTVVTGNAFGQAGSILCSNHIPGSYVYAWKNARISSVNPAACAIMKYDAEIRNSADPASKRREMIKLYTDEYADPVRAASTGLVDMVIEPDETRNRIITFLKLTAF